MTERNERSDRSSERSDRSAEHRQPEGVRIIGADEAQKAIDTGEASGRRGDDELRFGDVPPAPSGPRPQHRFPLPDSVDPAEAVPRSPVAPMRQESPLIKAPRASDDEVEPGDQDWAPDERGWAAGEGVRVVGSGGEHRPRVRTFGAEDAEEEPAAAYEDADPTGRVVPPPGGWDAPEPSPGVAGAHGARRWSRTRLSGRGAPRSDAPAPDVPPLADEPSAAPAESPAVPAEPPQPADGPLAWRAPPPAAAGDETATSPAGEDETIVSSSWAPPEAPPLRSYLDPPPPEDEPEAAALAPPEEGITVTGSTELPHWTEPPGGLPPSLTDPSRDDDLDAWNALGGSQGVRWRSEHDDWEDAGDTGYLAGEDVRVGALDQDRSEESDLFSFDEAFERLEEERSGAHPAVGLEPEEHVAVVSTATTPRRTRPARSRQRTRTTPEAGGGRRDLPSRVGIGVGLAALFVVTYLIGPLAMLALAVVGVLACAAELYHVLQHLGGPESRSDVGFRPATLLGLAATGGLMLAGYWKGPDALPVVLAVSVVAIMVWYLGGITDARPLANVAVTVMTVLWVGLLGSFAALMLRAPNGRGLFFGVVVVTVISDVVAYTVGRAVGRRPMAPRISPGKTVEGLVAGVVAALVVGAIVGHTLSPWGGTKNGILLGVVVAVLAPIGDLFESLIKRDLEMKDSGSALGGHGGLLDRFDSVLVVLPAAYYVATSLHLVRVVG